MPNTASTLKSHLPSIVKCDDLKLLLSAMVDSIKWELLTKELYMSLHQNRVLVNMFLDHIVIHCILFATNEVFSTTAVSNEK
jgi:hypothetical protein